jgi:hypothetical protein
MAKPTYKVIWSRGPTYAVEVTEPDGMRRIISLFARQEDEEAWIAEAKWRDAMGASKGDAALPKKPR